MLGDQRTRNGCAQQILPLIERVGAKHRKDVVTNEFLADVLDEDMLGLDAEQLGLAPRRLQLLALAEVGGEGDDLAAVSGLQPFQDYGSVEASRIGKDDAFDLGFRVGHGAAAL